MSDPRECKSRCQARFSRLARSTVAHASSARCAASAREDAVDVLGRVVGVRRDAQVAVALRGDDARRPRARATSAGASVERMQTSAPRRSGARGVATVPPSSSTPAISRSLSALTCSRVSAIPISSHQLHAGDAGVDVGTGGVPDWKRRAVGDGA